MPINTIFIVSDGTGGTATRLLDAAMTQFESSSVHMEFRPEVRSRARVREIVREALEAQGIIAHTLVSNDLRTMMLEEGRRRNVKTIDLIGPLLSQLTEFLAVLPKEKPGLFTQINAEYFRRIETMEFAIKHDDGHRVEEVGLAEIVLVGVSRTFKTPLSVYLAFKGWFVANVPLIDGIQPPAVLKILPPGRVFGLTMNARRLVTLRSAREEYLHHATGEYADLDFVRRELVTALHYFEQEPAWPVIDVTGKPIEEIAGQIIACSDQE